jgi:ssDNA-binding Zn-finger/Zn-ribbon topoisomerase 1
MHEEPSGTVACKECDGFLIVRQNKTSGGLFFGCSNFPRCRFTRYVSEFYHMVKMDHPQLDLFGTEDANAEAR